MVETDRKYIRETGLSVYFIYLIYNYSIYSVVVSTSPYPVPAINNTGHVTDWFDSLGECLQWNVRKQQKSC